MSSTDQLRRFTVDQTPVRGELVQLSASLKEVLKKHDYPTPVKRLLGEFMAAAALLSATLKFKGSLILQVSSEGQVPMLMAECRDQQFLRAIASYEEDIEADTIFSTEEIPEKSLFSNGKLAITIEPDKGQRYQGIVALEDSNLNGVLEDYFLQSEQLRTRIWLASDDDKAAGLLLQALPESADESSLTLQSEDWERIEMLSDTITNDELLSLQPETILHRLYHQEQVRIYPTATLEFSCTCSRERSENALLSIGEAEVRAALAASDNEILVDCQFCNAHYVFTETDVNTLFATQIH